MSRLIHSPNLYTSLRATLPRLVKLQLAYIHNITPPPLCDTLHATKESPLQLERLRLHDQNQNSKSKIQESKICKELREARARQAAQVEGREMDSAGCWGWEQGKSLLFKFLWIIADNGNRRRPKPLQLLLFRVLVPVRYRKPTVQINKHKLG
jgi:hypothetical protein